MSQLETDAVTAVADSDSEPSSSPRPEAGPPCPDVPLPTRLEVLLVSSERPLTELRLGELTGVVGRGAAKQIAAALAELNAEYERSGRSFRAVRVAGGWQLMTQPDMAPLVERLHSHRVESRLSQAAVETLAIIAYRQPIMRAEVEAIRGVACGEVIRSLLERRLIKIAGRAEQLGRPLLYGTTPQFLRLFGLGALDNLPPVDEGPRLTPTPEGTAHAESAPVAADAPGEAAREAADPGDDDDGAGEQAAIIEVK
jgi:segregation and condensation protein B